MPASTPDTADTAFVEAAFVEVAGGLRFPEGPVALADGTFLVVEIAGKTLTHIAADGTLTVIADLGGGPNGAAIGPDGRCYVCNNGGISFYERDGKFLPGYPPDDYAGGWIEAVDLQTGNVERLYYACDGVPLKAPNDLVFDDAGGFWFTDIGKQYRGKRERDLGTLYYAKADGSLIREALFPLDGPNGVGLSPDGKTVYVAESYTGRVWAFDIESPGQLRDYSGRPPWRRGRLHWAASHYAMLDSLAVDAENNVYVGDIPMGGISVISPEGERIEQIRVPDELTTNICFGGDDRRAMFITMSSTGRLVRVDGPRAGLRLNYEQ